jgi:hypothetical protein
VLKYAHLLVLVRQRLELTIYGKDHESTTAFDISVPHFADPRDRKRSSEVIPSVAGAAALSLCRANVQIGQWLHKDIRRVPAALTLRTCLLWDKFFTMIRRALKARLSLKDCCPSHSFTPVTEGLPSEIYLDPACKCI